MKAYFILILLLFSVTSGWTQTDTTNSEIELFPKQYGHKNWKMLVGLDARRSFFNGTHIKINGLRIGAEFRGVHRFGFGFYWLNKRVVFSGVLVGPLDQNISEPEVRYDLGYSSIFYERVFLKSRWWEVGFPVHLGGGQISGYYKDTIGAFQNFIEAPFVAFIPSTQIKFYPLSWIALRGSLGMRFTSSDNTLVKQTFRTAFYGYGLSINIIGLYKAVFRKEKNVDGQNEMR